MKNKEETRERMAIETAVISEIGRVIGSTLDIDEVYERFATEARKLILSDRILVNLNNPDGKTRTVAYIFGIDVTGRKPGDLTPIAGTPNEAILRKREGLIAQSEDGDALIAQFPSLDLAVWAGIRSFMAVPLFSRNSILGTLVFEATKPNAYSKQDFALAGRIGSQIAGAIANAQLYAELKKTKDRLQESEKELRKTLENLEITIKERTIELEEINIALRVLLKKGVDDQQRLGDDLQSNIKQLVMPFLSKLKEVQLDKESQAYLNILETNFNNIVSPFINRLSGKYNNLTPMEIKIAALIKDGKMSKEIAQLLGVSVGTIMTHRNNIRKKLRLRLKAANLRSHLLSLT
jgi:GAF domain-containing protein/DNA-binding CsgD family transcriptional regulator